MLLKRWRINTQGLKETDGVVAFSFLISWMDDIYFREAMLSRVCRSTLMVAGTEALGFCGATIYGGCVQFSEDGLKNW